MLNKTWHWEVETNDRVYYAYTKKEAYEQLRAGESIVRLEKIELHTS